ncbi:DUF3800 domain-containing protein [uncultured Fibrella sp.]|uniref:DUF3800 domain-containing protein n=1 Tax=uncultured Fibrella sp. TaxID=1284596 RepID=UPI0035C988BD
MVIGIDEVGDFSFKATDFNYFVAVLIDQNANKYSLKKQIFEDWEKTIPQKCKTSSGEVKGQLLNEELLENFYSEVLLKGPFTLCAIVKLIPNQVSKEDIDKIRNHMISEIDNQIIEFAKVGDTPILADYKKIRSWYKNRNYNNILKLLGLERVLSLSFEQSLGWGQITYVLDNEDISNIEKVRFLVDKDFIKAANTTRIHNELFRQYFQSNANKHHIPVVTGLWRDEDHPIWKVHQKMEDGKTGVKEAFRNKISFVDSDKSWEVRVADIVGTIIHRYENRDKCKAVGLKLMNSHFESRRKNFEYIKIVVD